MEKANTLTVGVLVKEQSSLQMMRLCDASASPVRARRHRRNLNVGGNVLSQNGSWSRGAAGDSLSSIDRTQCMCSFIGNRRNAA